MTVQAAADIANIAMRQADVCESNDVGAAVVNM
jgi:hypothetical protein